MDELGPLEIEFIINNPEVIAQAKQVESTLQGVSARAQANAEDIAKTITEIVNSEKVNIQNLTASTVEGLKIQLAQLQQIAALTPKSQTEKLSEYNKQIQGIQGEIKRLSNVGKEGFDEFGNAVNKSTNYVSKAWTFIRQIAYALPGIGIGTIVGFAVGPLIEFVAWLAKSNDALNEYAERVKATNEALDSQEFKKAITSVSELTEHIKLAKQGYLDKTEVLNEYNKELGKSLGYTNDLNTAEQLIIEKGQAYIKLTLLKATAQAALNEATAKQLEYEKAAQSNTNPEDSQNDKKDVSGFKNLTLWERLVSAFSQNNDVTQKLLEDGKARALKTAGDERDGLLKIYDDIEKQAAELAKKNHIDFFGGKETEKGQEAALNALLQMQISLREKLKEFTSKNEQKSLTPDQQALTAISDQFAAITFQISQANAKYDAFVKKYGKGAIDAFNANPDNKVKLAKTDPATLAAAQNAAIDNQADLNENNYIQQDIEKKKKLYADYYAYRSKVGEDAANKEYAELLLSGKDFSTYLSNIQKSIPADDQSGAKQKLRETVTKAQQQDAEDQRKRLDALLESVKTYEAERLTLTAVYQTKRKDLLDKGKIEEALVLDQQYKEQLEKLDDANVEKLAAVRELYSGITHMSADAAKNLIADVQAELNARIAAGTISAQEAKKLQGLIDQSTDSLNRRLPDNIEHAAEGLREMASAAALFNTELGDAIGLLASIAGNISKGISAYNDLQKAQKNNDTLGQITSSIPLLGAAVGIVTGVVNFFKAAHASAVQAAAQMKAYQDSLIIGEVQYNELLRDRARTQGDITKMTLEELKAREDLLATQKSQAQADYNNLLSTIQNQGQQITGEHTVKYGGILGIGKKTKVVQDLAGLNGADYDSLEKLYTEGKLDETTKAWFEQLQKVKGELDDIGVSSQAAADQLNKIATGTTANDIANAIVDGFKQGKRTAADFADDFKTLMQNAALSVFENEYLQGKIDDFYKQFAAAASSDGGLTDDKISQLRQTYAGIINDAGNQISQLEKVVGPINSNTTGAANNSTISGAIKGITETQANALEGAVRGMQLAVVQTNEILANNNQTMQSQLSEMKNQTLLQMQIAANTKRTADNTDEMKSSLKNIDKNTSDTAGNVLRAAGITN